MGQKKDFLYETVYYDLKQKIITEEYPLGSILPNEPTLAKKYKTSRVTIRTALQKLADEHYILRRTKVGTSVIFKSLNDNRTVFALIMPFSHTRKINTHILTACYNEAQKLNISLVVYNTANDNETDALKDALSKRIHGILLYPISEIIPIEISLAILEKNIPLVFLDRRVQIFRDCPLVTTDNIEAMSSLVKKIIKKGYQNIAYLGNTTQMHTTETERLRGWLQALYTNHLHIDSSMILNIKDWTTPSSPATFSMRKLLIYLREQHKLPQVICCFNDYYAIALLAACNELGIRVPQELAITGFDNLDESKSSNPSLTTVGQNFLCIGQKAIQVLYALHNKEIIKNSDIRIPAKLYYRQSALLSPYKQKKN